MTWFPFKITKAVDADVNTGGEIDFAAGTLEIGGVAITASAAEINALAGAGISNAEATVLGSITADAAEINKLDGMTATKAELNVLDDIPGGTVAFAVAGGAQNVAVVTCTVKDAAGVAMTRPVLCYVWLSDSATGEGLAAQPDAIAVSAGTQIAVLTANKAVLAQTTAAGVLGISVTDAAQTAMKICVQPVGCHMPTIGDIATGDYTD